MDVFYDPGPSRAVVKHLLAFIVMNRFCVALSCGRPKMAVSGMGTYMCCGGDARAARGARARARSAAAAAVMRARGGAKTCTILAPAGAEKMISRRWRGPTWVGEVCVLAHGGGGDARGCHPQASIIMAYGSVLCGDFRGGQPLSTKAVASREACDDPSGSPTHT